MQKPALNACRATDRGRPRARCVHARSAPNAATMLAIFLNSLLLLSSAASSASAYKPSQRMSIGLWPMPAEVRHAAMVESVSRDIGTRCCRSAFTPLCLPFAAGPGYERKHNSVCRQFQLEVHHGSWHQSHSQHHCSG